MSLNISPVNLNQQTIRPPANKGEEQKSNTQAPYSSHPQPSFGLFEGIFSSSTNKKESINSKAQTDMANVILKELSPESKEKFLKLLNTPKINDANSNDGTTTLENLYKIAKNERFAGITSKQVLEQTIGLIRDPYTVQQQFVRLPNEKLIQIYNDDLKTRKNTLPNDAKTPQDLLVEAGATCTVASMEFTLADKSPSEFVRIIEGITSPKNEVQIKRKFSDINPNTFFSLCFIDDFKTPHKIVDKEHVEFTIKPDRNAIVRARAQMSYKQPLDRSFVDALVQSTFMQLGSQQTYNSLTDKRYGQYNLNDTGLTEYEKTYVENIIGGNTNTTSLTYQIPDDNLKITSRTADYETMKNQLLQTLSENKDVIIGITGTNDKGEIVGGHEITLTGARMENNEYIFTYQDSDDDKIGPVEIKAKDLLPVLHHATISNNAIKKQAEPDVGLETLKYYNNVLSRQPK